MVNKEAIEEACNILRLSPLVSDETVEFLLKTGMDNLSSLNRETKKPEKASDVGYPSTVIVKDGRTTNLPVNRPAIDGDYINQGFASVKSDPSLPDGEYSFKGFERVLQFDDSANVWKMSFDDQYILSMGWPTRIAFYFFKENLGNEDKRVNKTVGSVT